MSEIALNLPDEGHEHSYNFVVSFIMAIMSLPGGRVDRAFFLRDQLKNHCSDTQVETAIASSPASAGIPSDLIDKLADEAIQSQVVLAAAGSFVAGIPGGLALALTIPADMSQYVLNAIVLAQKLAYLYGWPDLLNDGEMDDATVHRVLLLMGIMFAAGNAKNVIDFVAKAFADEVGKKLPQQALTKTFYYPIVKEICKWLGIKVTKKSFAEGVAKVIPFLGGIVGATVTTVTFHPMAHNLKDHLKELRFAKEPDHNGPDSVGC